MDLLSTLADAAKPAAIPQQVAGQTVYWRVKRLTPAEAALAGVALQAVISSEHVVSTHQVSMPEPQWVRVL